MNANMPFCMKNSKYIGIIPIFCEDVFLDSRGGVARHRPPPPPRSYAVQCDMLNYNTLMNCFISLFINIFIL